MSDADDTTLVSSAAPLALAGGYGLEVRASDGSGRASALDVRAPDGRVCLTIRLDDGGPRVEITAASLSVRADDLALEAKKDLALRAGGGILLEAQGALVSRALEQHIEATRGDILVEANDDVRLEGERVRLNSPDAPPLRRLVPKGGEGLVSQRANGALPSKGDPE